MAAPLHALKTRRLLADADDLELDEERALWSERDLLLTRLVECKTFKDVAVALEHLANDAGRSYPRVAGPDERFVELTPDLLAGVPPADLRAAFLRAATPHPHPRIDPHTQAPIRPPVTDSTTPPPHPLPYPRPATFP